MAQAWARKKSSETPAAAVSLDRAVDDAQRDVRRDDLDHRDLGAGLLVADRVHHVGGLEGQEAGLIDLDPRVGDPLADHPLLGQRLAEGDPPLDAPDQRLQGALGHPDRAHAVVDPPRAEPTLGDREALPLAPEDVLGGDVDIVEGDLGVAVRRVVVAEDRQGALDHDAGGVERHEDHRLLLVARGAGIGATHHDRDLAAWVARAGTPPLAPVEDVFVVVADDIHLDIGGVG